MNVIEVKNLTKTYGSYKAIDDISFCVEEGTIFGLLGPNGAGKTTSIECMIGIKKPDSGSISILGMDVLEIGKKIYDFIGVQLQETSYQDKVKVIELCDLFSSMYDNPIDYIPYLKNFGLESKHKPYITDLSGGQKQKVAITLALIANPKVVFLDELTTGLDPQARREMWDLVKELKEEGRTVFITTHYMEEASYLCDNIGIIDAGKLVVLNNVDGVIDYANLENMVSFKCEEDISKELYKHLDIPFDLVISEGVVKVFSAYDDLVSKIVLFLHKKNIRYSSINIQRPNLEDAYLKLTGKKWEV